jgi:flavin reductase (DIM6/NTAB) family NADH-FMN oxidoreductase RutF
MEFSPETLPWNQLYKLMIGAVVPRPIGWISTLDTQGRPNLAPFSFFNAVCANPPHVLFCPMVRGSDAETKDSLRNVRETGEFVVNIVTEALAEAMNATSGEYPAEINEFEVAGLTPVPSVVVRAFRVRESPVHFECRTAHIVDLGDEPGGGSVVIGRVVHVHVREDVLLDGDKINLEALQPIGRLAGNFYCRVNDLFQMTRPVVKVVEP